jgi:hypothetical protein
MTRSSKYRSANVMASLTSALMNEVNRRVLRAVIDGDLAWMSLIESWTQDQLAEAAIGTELVLRHDAVARVLNRYATGQIASVDVQRWASFVRRGYVAGRRDGSVLRLNISFESAHETAISEAVARLDELGDLVDGVLREGEIDELIANLALDD